ncbi:hypothetical protein B0T16DRAFT_394107 [Cercophora newfieldiana]|uniref:Apple domain-containing protein n=1 Tax=Cercophora newfieldiana TaxID=92897 RepID=A0AA40CLI7_9PEZI|nr:hypothetical protein B0T16DRAFT_394107 [Cercophora newfieldiana]
MLFHILLAILGGGLLGAAIPPPYSPVAQLSPLVPSVSSVVSAVSHSDSSTTYSESLKDAHIADSKMARASRVSAINGRDNVAPAPQSTQASGDWSPQCPKDNHALASITSSDLKTEYRFALECSKDRVGSDMPGMPVDQPDWYSCARACVDAYDGGAGCVSFTWRHDFTKCYLKNTVPSQTDFAEAWSGVLTITSESKSKDANSTDWVIARSRTSHMDLPAEPAFRHDTPDEQTAPYDTEFPAPRGNLPVRSLVENSADSGTIDLKDGINATYYKGWDHHGGDISGVDPQVVSSFNDCAVLCHQTRNCEFYTWRMDNSLCYRKDDSARNRYYDEHVVGGAMVASQVPTPFSPTIKKSDWVGVADYDCPKHNFEIATISESPESQIWVAHLECSFDRPQEDARYFPLNDTFRGNSWEKCLGSCFEAEVYFQTGCSSFSFRSQNEDGRGGCYLKNKKNGEFAPTGLTQEGVWSGVLMNLNHPFHGDSVFPAPVTQKSTSSTTSIPTVQPTIPTSVQARTAEIRRGSSPGEVLPSLKTLKRDSDGNRTCPAGDGNAYWIPFSTSILAYKFVATLECNMNRRGGDVARPIPSVGSWEECAEKCQATAINIDNLNSGCVAFAWQSTGDRNCYLKAGQVPLAEPEEGVWSGVLQTKQI